MIGLPCDSPTIGDIQLVRYANSLMGQILLFVVAEANYAFI